MSAKYGPTRKEHWFRLAFSLVGLAMVFYALVIQGQGLNVMTFDGIAFGGLFFLGSPLN